MNVPRLETLLGWLEATMRLRGIKRHEWERDGAKLSYHEYGRTRPGRTLVLVHGLGTSTLSWVKVFGALGAKHHVLAIDLPGWGFSPPPPGKEFATIQDMVSLVTRFIETVSNRPVVLVGQSMGGWVCAKVAAARPDLIEELVLSNNAGVLYPEVGELRQRMDLKSQADVEAFWKEMWHQVPSMYRYFRADYVTKMHEPRIVGFFDSLTEADFINHDLPKLTMPVSILWGTSDRFIPMKTVDLMLPELPNARVYWIPRCGHIPALEQPREFIRILNGVLLKPNRDIPGAPSV